MHRPTDSNLNRVINRSIIQIFRLFLEYGDLTDSSNLCEIIARVRPDEIYNLGAQSHVKVRRCYLDRAGVSFGATAVRLAIQGLSHYCVPRPPITQVSFEMSEYTANVDALGTLRLLNAMRTCGLEKSCRWVFVFERVRESGTGERAAAMGMGDAKRSGSVERRR